jgi:hypothetical protein
MTNELAKRLSESQLASKQPLTRMALLALLDYVISRTKDQVITALNQDDELFKLLPEGEYPQVINRVMKTIRAKEIE